MKKLKVLKTFEQGLDRKFGGSFKLFAPKKGELVLEAKETEAGMVINVDGNARVLSPTIVDKLTGLGVIEVE